MAYSNSKLHELTPQQLQRFNGYVKKTGTCWLWQSCLYKNGYGSFYCQGRSRYAHRTAYVIANGAIPEGLCVLHKCDVRNCVRPDHLFLGTFADNNRDMGKKGRSRLSRPHRILRGEELRQSKLTEEIVKAVRQRFADGGVTRRQISEEFGLPYRTIIGLINRTNWKHVP